MEVWLTIDQAAEALGLHRSTVIRQIKEGTIRGARRIGRQYRVPAAAVRPVAVAEAVWTHILAELAGDRLADVERARAAETEAALALSAACIGWPIDRDRLDAARLALDKAMRDCAAAEARYAAAT